MIKFLLNKYLIFFLIQNNNKQTFQHTLMLFYQSLVFVGLAPTTKRVTTQAG
jgi:hypothetical protein